MLSDDGKVVFSGMLQFFFVWVATMAFLLYADDGLGGLLSVRALVVAVVGLVGAWLIGQAYALVFIWWAVRVGFENWTEVPRGVAAFAFVVAFCVATWAITRSIYYHWVA